MRSDDDVGERLARVEKKLDQILKLVRLSLGGEDVPRDKQRRVAPDGRREMFVPGSGWVTEWPEPRKKRLKW